MPLKVKAGAVIPFKLAVEALFWEPAESALTLVELVELVQFLSEEEAEEQTVGGARLPVAA